MGAAETQVEPGIAGLDVLVARVDSEWITFMGTCNSPDRSPQSLTQGGVHDHLSPVSGADFPVICGRAAMSR
jgi:hypothetical protein